MNRLLNASEWIVNAFSAIHAEVNSHVHLNAAAVVHPLVLQLMCHLYMSALRNVCESHTFSLGRDTSLQIYAKVCAQ